VAITGFRHKGLERFFATGAKLGIQAKHADRLRLILGRLNVATSAKDMVWISTNSAVRERVPGPLK
jgi:plasmid maintenance system killer protein